MPYRVTATFEVNNRYEVAGQQIIVDDLAAGLIDGLSESRAHSAGESVHGVHVSVTRLRDCAVCGTRTFERWCSDACERDDQGDEDAA